MSKTIEIYRKVNNGQETFILETTSRDSETIESTSYKQTTTGVKTEEFTSMTHLSSNNRATRIWSGLGMGFGGGLGLAFSLKTAEQILLHAAGNYQGNPIVDIGVDIGALVGAVVTFETSRGAWRQTSRVSARLRELTSQGLATVLPTRS